MIDKETYANRVYMNIKIIVFVLVRRLSSVALAWVRDELNYAWLS